MNLIARFKETMEFVDKDSMENIFKVPTDLYKGNEHFMAT